MASFVVSGILHQELFFQSGRELLLVWERVKDVLPAVRQQYKDPHLWANLETVGGSPGISSSEAATATTRS